MKNSKNLEKIVNDKKELFEKKKTFEDILSEAKEKYFGKRTPKQEIEKQYISTNLSSLITTVSALRPEFILIETPFALYNLYLGNKFDKIENTLLNEDQKNKKDIYKKNFLKGAIIGSIVGIATSYFLNKFNIDTNYGITVLQYTMAGGCLLGTHSLKKTEIIKEYVSFFNE
ncbi:MAG: hypothetical protein QW210_04520 [Candidatus Woesearchaeota archaeon]